MTLKIKSIYTKNQNEYAEGTIEIPTIQRLKLWLLFKQSGQKEIHLEILEEKKPIKDKNVIVVYADKNYCIFRDVINTPVTSKKGYFGLCYFIVENGQLRGDFTVDLEKEKVHKIKTVDDAVIEVCTKKQIYCMTFVRYKVDKECHNQGLELGPCCEAGAPVNIFKYPKES